MERQRPAGEVLSIRLDPRGRRNAFSFVEILIATAIGAAVIGTAAVAFSAASKARSQTYGTLTLPAGAFSTFYGGATSNTQVETYFAPNYGRVAAADNLRDIFLQDIQYSTAVFCLARPTFSKLMRPTNIAVTTSNFDARAISTSDDFRTLLSSGYSTNATTVFSSGFRGPAPAQNLSIFVLQRSSSITNIPVRAVYEVDFVSATAANGLSGTYASVRRYDSYRTGNEAPTDYYDVYYPGNLQDSSTRDLAFLPVAVQFERSLRTVKAESSDVYKVAANRPFYFVWWPDPSSPFLAPTSTSTFNSSDVRYGYKDMANRTSFFMVVPMFPPL